MRVSRLFTILTVVIVALTLLTLITGLTTNISRYKEENILGINITGIKVYIICDNDTVKGHLTEHLKKLGASIVENLESSDICIIDVEAKLDNERISKLREIFLRGKGIIVFSFKANMKEMAKILEEIVNFNKPIYLKFKSFTDRLKYTHITVTVTRTCLKCSKDTIKSKEEMHPFIFVVGIKLGYGVFRNETYTYPITSSAMCQSLSRIPEIIYDEIMFVLNNLSRKHASCH